MKIISQLTFHENLNQECDCVSFVYAITCSRQHTQRAVQRFFVLVEFSEKNSVFSEKNKFS